MYIMSILDKEYVIHKKEFERMKLGVIIQVIDLHTLTTLDIKVPTADKYKITHIKCELDSRLELIADIFTFYNRLCSGTLACINDVHYKIKKGVITFYLSGDHVDGFELVIDLNDHMDYAENSVTQYVTEGIITDYGLVEATHDLFAASHRSVVRSLVERW